MGGIPVPEALKQREAPVVGIIMGSQSDWSAMAESAATLTRLAVPHEVKIVSAHRTPDRLRAYAVSARERGLQVIIAGAGGAAHLPGMCASWTSLPVLGVPIESHALKGMDSLLSIVQMPAGVPVGTLAIGRAGAVNAALLAAAILAIHDGALAGRLDALRAEQTAGVADAPGSVSVVSAGAPETSSVVSADAPETLSVVSGGAPETSSVVSGGAPGPVSALLADRS
jgi:5-(carboxyamino)imidazole ribonucleotide mutase